MAEAAVYDEKLRQYVLQTFGDISHKYSGFVPGICRFSELISVNHTMNHHNYICRSFSERNIPFPGNRDFYYRHTFPVRTEILKVHITPRIRMPLSQLSSKADELYEKYSTLPKKEAYEKIIPELALFYGVSEFTAGKRLNDLIYSRKLQ